MATRTISTAENGLIEFQVDYDTSNRITALRCINNANYNIIGEVTRLSNGRSYSKTFLANSNTYIPIPTSVSQRIQFDGFGVHNDLLGLSFRFY